MAREDALLKDCVKFLGKKKIVSLLLAKPILQPLFPGLVTSRQAPQQKHK